MPAHYVPRKCFLTKGVGVHREKKESEKLTGVSYAWRG